MSDPRFRTQLECSLLLCTCQLSACRHTREVKQNMQLWRSKPESEQSEPDVPKRNWLQQSKTLKHWSCSGIACTSSSASCSRPAPAVGKRGMILKAALRSSAHGQAAGPISVPGKLMSL